MPLTISYIKDIVGGYYSVGLSSKSRKRSLARPRQIVMYLSRKYTGLSYQAIGEQIGGRNHSTIWHGCDLIDKLYKTDKIIKFDIDNIQVFLEAAVKRDKLDSGSLRLVTVGTININKCIK